MLITLIFKDASKQYDLDITQFPTIADYVELTELTELTELFDLTKSAGSAKSNNLVEMSIPEYFTSSSMDLLLDIIKTDMPYVKGNMFGIENPSELINVDYTDIIFFEYIGFDIFNVKISNKTTTINVNLLNIDKNEIKKLDDDEIIIYDGIIIQACYNTTKSIIQGVGLSKQKANWDTARIIYTNFTDLEPDKIYKYTCYAYTTYFYKSRINIISNNINWQLLEMFCNCPAIKPLITPDLIKLSLDDDVETMMSKINLLHCVQPRSFDDGTLASVVQI